MGENVKHESSRYWLIAINNPLDYGFDHARIKDILNNGAEIRYWCMSDEIGDEGTFHTHIFAYWVRQMRFNTLRNKFDGKSHIEYPYGTPQQNRDYVFKEGKWLDDPKGDINIRDSHEEYGECPIHRPGSRTDLSGLYDLIKDGKSNYEILEIDPNYIKQIESLLADILTNRLDLQKCISLLILIFDFSIRIYSVRKRKHGMLFSAVSIR